ncbi:hypothetical protein RR42_m2462 [Cupriavidus basilensis]|uniref:Uncharacterized protein n=1 Tax=Cupriavidus basilensis TaxID=68895 RepID=A0A0C4YCH5_9BURK|nr:hypothetical protein RR42_m2462 [Cupriavidus basilensis]
MEACATLAQAASATTPAAARSEEMRATDVMAFLAMKPGSI